MSVVRPQGSTPPFRRTACHALFSLLLSGTCALAWAAEPQPLANTQARSYQIPAGTLGQT